MPMKDKTFEVKNPGPVKEFTLRADKGPGVYVLAGPNGAGKSSILRAIAKALGYAVPVNLRHGAKTLSVELDGENLLETSKVKPTGDIENALIKASPLARFIQPGMADDDRNEAARNEAFFELVDIPVTEEAISVLVQGNSAALEFVFEREGDDLLKEKIVDAADKVRRRVHELKRQYEAEGVKAQAEIDANPADKPAIVSKVSALDAKTQYEMAVRNQERLRGQNEQREQQERQVEEIKRTQGERPDPEAAEEQWHLAHENAVTVAASIQALREQLAKASAEHSAKVDLEHRALETLDQTRKDAVRWDKNKALLGQEISGASTEDLEAAILQVQEAEQSLDRAKHTEAWQLALQRRKEAQERREASYASAAEIEKVATAVTSQLALLFEEAGVEGLTIEEGRLCQVGEDGETEPIYELSVGERSRIGCELLVRNKFPHDTGILPGSFWQNMDENNKVVVHTEVAKAGLYFYTEEPHTGELRVFQQPTEIILEGQQVEDAVAKKGKATGRGRNAN